MKLSFNIFLIADDIRDMCDDLILAKMDMPKEETEGITDSHLMNTLLDVFAGTYKQEPIRQENN